MIKQVNVSWFYRQQLNLIFTQEAVEEEDERSSYQSMLGDMSRDDNNVEDDNNVDALALDMVDNDGGDSTVEGEGDKEEQGNKEGQMSPFQVHEIISYF